MTEERGMNAAASGKIDEAMRVARRAAEIAVSELYGDVEGHSFDSGDIDQRKESVNIICCSAD